MIQKYENEMNDKSPEDRSRRNPLYGMYIKYTSDYQTVSYIT
jgi:hypothetical protein